MQMLHAEEQKNQMQRINPSQIHKHASQMYPVPANA
jgi:hypothetical protein